MASKVTSVFLDRIEGPYGVLLTKDGRSVDIPVSLLPEGIHEGAALTLTLELDEAATADGKGQVASLMDELLKRSGG